MKTKMLFLAVLIASLSTTNAQVSISIPAGFSTLKAPTIGANAQIGIGRLILAAGFDAQLSKDIMKGNFYWSRIGASIPLNELNSIEASIGAGQYRRSSDVKSLNMGLALANVQFVHQMISRPEASLFISATGTKKFAMFTGGLRFTFLKKGYCPANSRM